jgi:Flp pilus assembly pilin Flp
MLQLSSRLTSFAWKVAGETRRCAAVVLRSRDRGQDLVEYGVAVAVVAVVVLVAIQAFGTGIAAFFTRLLTHFAPLG